MFEGLIPVDGLLDTEAMSVNVPAPPEAPIVDAPVGSKRCTGCGLVKPLDAFTPHAGIRDGRQPRCKACRADYIRERRRADPLLAARDRAQNEAYHAALRLLRGRHRAEFDDIYASELAIRLAPEEAKTDA